MPILREKIPPEPVRAPNCWMCNFSLRGGKSTTAWQRSSSGALPWRPILCPRSLPSATQTSALLMPKEKPKSIDLSRNPERLLGTQDGPTDAGMPSCAYHEGPSPGPRNRHRWAAPPSSSLCPNSPHVVAGIRDSIDGGLPTAADFSPQVAEPACQPAHFGPRLVLKTARRSEARPPGPCSGANADRGLASGPSRSRRGPSQGPSFSGPSRPKGGPPGASHHWSRAVKLDRKIPTEGSWTGVPCEALPPPTQLERTEAAARREITPIPLRAHPRHCEQRSISGSSVPRPSPRIPQPKQDSSCLASLETPPVLKTVSTAPPESPPPSTPHKEPPWTGSRRRTLSRPA